MKIAVLVLFGLTFVTFLTLFVCWAKVGLAVFRIHMYVRSYDHSIPLVFTPNTLKCIHEYFFCHKCCADADKFNAAYKTILDSGVHFSRNREASQDIVYCATQSDIPKLKELRRRALYRQSDECFYDYRALTRVIQMVRTCASK